ncbi:putative outer membrane protein A [Calothrix parasitica NIES-267]|uniref:Putative outer membrane protein A n=1 Tax=Calothrix parasitica NIES-267 TaxID=1973488 RepID=A0A1Z4LP57_9CYAN|nr:putative outer membrane protein A [Calothrix parasitica NIES-267]
MSKRESPIGFISILVATFGLSVAGIWSAYQFGFGSYSDEEYIYTESKKNISIIKESNKLKAAIKNTPTPKPTATPTPKKLKTADDIAQNPVQAQIQFLSDSNRITSQGLANLNQLKQEISEFKPQNLAIRIYSNPDKSDFGQQIATQRGEEIAGYLRHLGLTNKIVISKRIPNTSANNLSSQQKRNQPVLVQLYKLN